MKNLSQQTQFEKISRKPRKINLHCKGFETEMLLFAQEVDNLLKKKEQKRAAKCPPMAL